MKKLLALVLSLLLVASCLAMSISAEDTTEGEETVLTNTVLTFNAETVSSMKVLSGHTGISKPICNSGWEGVRLKLNDVGDPYVFIQWSKYIERAGLESLDSQSYPYVAFKLKVEGYVEDIELFFCAGEITTADPTYSSTTDLPCESSGDIEYIIFDLTDDCEGNYNSFRFDPVGADEDTIIYLCEMAFFATEDEAFAYAGYGEDSGDGEDGEGDEATTEESVEETEEQTEETTEKKTEKETTKAQKTEKETEAADEGCGGIISIGAVVAMISLGIVCIKKKD